MPVADDGWGGQGDFFPYLFINCVLRLVFFSSLETKAACVPAAGCGGCRRCRDLAVVPCRGALGGRFPPHTDGCFDSVERLT